MIEDEIIERVKKDSAYYSHLNIPTDERKAFDRLVACKILIKTGNLTYKFSDVGHELVHSKKKFERWIHPPFYIKFGRWLLSLFRPALNLIVRGNP